ncbi:hypothetical protein AVEN_16938-1 [Araneus ventricosus]|uniref:Uncharacterized protein n=1 Tax=Araneus ventricosus TaxID=182803 RepID=A0A4Y2UUA4_ARAVE|nr:hypothetical protein AVEN_16938-1 [Araneus ventricosus]
MSRFAFIVDAQDTSSGTVENDVKSFASAKATRTPYSRRDSDFDIESIQSYGADDNYSHPTPTRQRSSSPDPRRCSNRRQSQSPVRRSSRSPRRFNEEN